MNMACFSRQYLSAFLKVARYQLIDRARRCSDAVAALQADLADARSANATLAEDNAAKDARVHELEGHLIALARARRADETSSSVSEASSQIQSLRGLFC